jgi:hypothetical protein
MKLTTFWGPLTETEEFCEYLGIKHNYSGCEEFQRKVHLLTGIRRDGCWNCKLKEIEKG